MSLPTEEDRQYDRLSSIIDDLVGDLNKIYHEGPFEVTPTTSPRRAEAVRCIKDLITYGQAHLDNHTFAEDISSETIEWFEALSYLLFDEEVMDERFDRDVGWDTEDGDYLGWVTVDDSTITVRINAYAHTDIFDFIGILLHEMVHIFIEQNAKFAGVWDLPKHSDVVKVYDKLDGESGHGYYFQKLARAVEDAARAGFGAKKIDLGHKASIHMEYQTSGKLPDLAYFEEVLGIPKYEDQPTAFSFWEDLAERDAGLK